MPTVRNHVIRFQYIQIVAAEWLLDYREKPPRRPTVKWTHAKAVVVLENVGPALQAHYSMSSLPPCCPFNCNDYKMAHVFFCDKPDLLLKTL